MARITAEAVAGLAADAVAGIAAEATAGTIAEVGKDKADKLALGPGKQAPSSSLNVTDTSLELVQQSVGVST
jgi:hypothetical protein